MNGKLTCDEVKKLFYKGNLGEQYFVKSRKAFCSLKWIRSHLADETRVYQSEAIARKAVCDFLAKREIEIAKRVNPGFMTVIDALADNYRYVKDGDWYEKI